jgi:hypothetical protein
MIYFEHILNLFQMYSQNILKMNVITYLYSNKL